MKKMELMAPAGDFESLKMAVYYGADAVYLGIKKFNARNNIIGFNLDNLKQAVDFAHIYGVKVYLTLNILFSDSEIQEALNVVKEANNLDVDAFIVQDLGLASLIRELYPSVELHASTQMGIHNLEGVRVLEKLGFKRVVLSRETSLHEIRRIHNNSNIEIEFFVQGALCVSFSGNCYMCSHLVDKSGNRGVCQQFCRLPYTFECGKVEKEGFLLSAKDISLLDSIDELYEAGVSSLKIEGRARRSFYVAQACKIYRDALDNGGYSYKDYENLQIAFNREYTPAYFNGNGTIISKIQGNNGLYIGKVQEVKNGKKFNEIFIETKYDLKPKSGLKFVLNGEEVGSIGAVDVKKVGKYYRVTTTSKIAPKSKVYIISNEELEKELSGYIRKLPIDVKMNLDINKPIEITAKYQDIEVKVLGDVCQEAKTISISKEQVFKQLCRSDLFEVADFNFNNDNCYILNSAINHLRNELYEQLKNRLIEKFDKIKLENVIINKFEKSGKISNNFDFEIVEDLRQIKGCKHIVYDYNIFDVKQLVEFDKSCKDKGVDGYIDLPVFATDADIKLIQSIISSTDLGVVVNNLYGLSFDCKKIGGQFLNIYNSYTINLLTELSEFQAFFVEELTNIQLNKLNSSLPLLRREKAYMTLVHCPFKSHIGGDCANCKFDDATYTINTGKCFAVKRKKTANCVFVLKD